MAAIRVLAAGAGNFTTVRVAEVAGVSVGSLYQYYPNRAALLLALHEREVAAAWRQVAQLLAARELPPRERIAGIVAYYFRSEAGEAAPMRDLMHELDATPQRTANEQALLAEAAAGVAAFLGEVGPPGLTPAELRARTDLFFTVVESVGKRIASRGLDEAALAWWARSCSEMLCDHLEVR